MLIEILLINDRIIWNFIILFSFSFFLFYAIGRIIQKRLSFNQRSFMITIPLGFIIFSLFNFLFYLPMVFLSSSITDDLVFFLNLIKTITILIVVFVYFQEWFPTSSFLLKKIKLSKQNFISILFIFFFILITTSLNFFDNFNNLNDDSLIKYNSSTLTSTISLNKFLMDNLIPLYISKEIYYKWFLFFLISFMIYFSSQYWVQEYSKNNILNKTMGLILSIVLINFFWLTSSKNILFFQFFIFMISISILKYFYNSWNQNNSTLILSYFSLFSLFTFSMFGLYILLAFIVATNIFKTYYERNKNNSILIGSYLISCQIFLLLYINFFLISIIFLFFSLIFLIPSTTNANYKNKSNLKISDETEENKVLNSESKNISIIFFFVFLFLLLIFILFSTKIIDYSLIDFFVNNYYIFPFNVWYFNLILITFVITIPLWLIFIFGYLKSSNPKWYSIFSIVLIMFFNPVIFSFINNLLGITTLIFYLFVPLVLLEITFLFIKKILINKYHKIKRLK